MLTHLAESGKRTNLIWQKEGHYAEKLSLSTVTRQQRMRFNIVEGGQIKILAPYNPPRRMGLWLLLGLSGGLLMAYMGREPSLPLILVFLAMALSTLILDRIFTTPEVLVEQLTNHGPMLFTIRREDLTAYIRRHKIDLQQDAGRDPNEQLNDHERLHLNLILSAAATATCGLIMLTISGMMDAQSAVPDNFIADAALYVSIGFATIMCAIGTVRTTIMIWQLKKLG